MKNIKKISSIAIMIFVQSLAHAGVYEIKPYPQTSEGQLIAMTKEQPEPKYTAKSTNEGELSQDTPLILGGSFLVWKTRTTDSIYAMSSSTTQFALPYKSMLREVNFSYDLGLRFSLGYNGDHDDWSYISTFTYLKADHSARTKSGMWGDLKAPNGFSKQISDTVLSGSGLEEVTFQRASSCYDLKYRTLDFLIRKGFMAGLIEFVPQIGLEGSLLVSKQKNYYSGGTLLSNNTLSTEFKDRFWGVGPKTAIGMKWGLKRGFSIAQDLAFSFMLGDLKTYYGENISNNINAWTKLSGRDKVVVPHASYDIGLAYDKEVDFLFKYVHTKLAFEGQYLWNFTQKILSGEDLDFGNLYMYGLTFNLELDF
ncbi:MAG: Lpg1974 family pore-forming outer membrane protein [Rhabdochlamydiaceae bacterium]|nr:Lpg1974 family pore-forming outer membrane protein [Candidatus Amphrikana amoebophyrae]